MKPSRPGPDDVLTRIADYVCGPEAGGAVAFDTARLCLLDSIGCALLALNYPACTKLLGPDVPGTVVPHGARVPGTDFVLDPVKAAFDIGTAVRWLDYNDTWLAAEWGHPSDNFGAILAVADHLSRRGGRNFNPHPNPLPLRERADTAMGGAASVPSPSQGEGQGGGPTTPSTTLHSRQNS